MNKLILKIIGVFLIIYVGLTFLGLGEIHSVYSAFFFSLVFIIVNVILKPILLLVSLPINLITLGLFSLVVNTWIVLITDAFVKGIKINGFLSGLILSLLISAFHMLFIKPAKNND